ncbi:MAG: ankyrin repeat domain-containing protein [Spirochaetes bacterium]|nr:ankyrin repeat domain-containing protein [Spirochaetota bacterium]
MKKELAYQNDRSNKFWKIETKGKNFTVTYGKAGTGGKTQTKEFDSEDKCKKEADRLIAEKLKKGYTEAGKAKAVLKKTKKTSAKKEIIITNTKKNPKPKAKKIITADSLLDEADAMLDNDIYAGEKKVRSALKLEPDNLKGLHYLNWILIQHLDKGPEETYNFEEIQPEQKKLNELILEKTKSIKPIPGNPQFPQKARALALVQKIIGGLLKVTNIKEAELLYQDAIEAVKYRDEDFTRLTMRKALAAKTLILANTGKFDEAFETVRAIAADPSVEYTDLDGLQPVLDDPGFIEWVRKLDKRTPKNVHPDYLNNALCDAAGKKAYASNNNQMEDDQHKGRVGRLLCLLQAGAKIEAVSDDKTPLHWAARVGDIDALNLLIDEGAAIDARDDEGHTPLRDAVEMGRTEIVKRLLSLKADPNARGEDSRTPLFETTTNRDCIAALVEAGADPNVNDGYGTPLHLAARMGAFDVAMELLARGADPNAKRKDGVTPLGEALEYNNGKIAALLKGGAPDTNSPFYKLKEQLKKSKKEILNSSLFQDDSVKRLEEILDSLTFQKFESWNQLASACDGEVPWIAWAATELLRQAVPAGELVIKFNDTASTISGDLRIEGDLNLSVPLLVTGNLTVSGVINDCGPDSLLAVAGNLSARGLDTDGEVIVGGDVRVDDVIWGTYNDESLSVGGGLKSPVLIEDDHCIEVNGKLDVKYYKYSNTDKELMDIFIPDVFTKKGKELDKDKLFKHISEGKNVFK